ncbi:MAG: hypothetical protein B1H11_12300 [Desulfobacteraceae bacterium 4484_190.1]|nr:MAG: hypothetical protein B1H11_12300 [Desulfobacteraceae bacterium 4484_190.1]
MGSKLKGQIILDKTISPQRAQRTQRFNVKLLKIKRVISHRGHRDTESIVQLNYLSSKIIQAAINVHKELGPGLLESVYQVCMVIELCDRHIMPIFQRRKTL